MGPSSRKGKDAFSDLTWTEFYQYRKLWNKCIIFNGIDNWNVLTEIGNNR